MIHPEAMIDNTTVFWHAQLSNIGFCTIGRHTIVHSHVWIGDKVKIGDDCRIQAFSFIPTNVRIGDRVFIGPRVTFTNDKYPPSEEWLITIVMDDVSIGAGAIILPGVTLGQGCTVGAGAVVTKSIPPGETWLGNPAKKYENRT
jgi:UDP-2-acetamido-3-amino-2,3-dideoxy-glucuronate N-acetyltransferase